MALTKVTGSVIKDSVSLSGNVSVGGTLTYQDVTNVDALGVGTFRTGIKVLAGQVDVGSNIKLGNAGVVTATSFVGSGANLTSLPAQATIANNADNRVITGGSGVNLNGEANLNFDGTGLGLVGHIDIRTGSSINTNVTGGGASGTLHKNTNSGEFAIVSGGTGGNNHLTFYTSASAAPTEKLRIDSSGNVMMGVTSSSNRFHVEGTTTGSRFGVDDSASGITALAITNETNADLETVIYTNKASLGSSVNIPICFHTNGKANEKMRLDTSGRILLGDGAIATPKASVGGLDVSSGIYSIIMGGETNVGDGTGRRNSYQKESRLGMPHYTNAEEPFGLVYGVTISGENRLNLGGGSGIVNAATRLSLYTATNTTTTAGTEQIRMTGEGIWRVGKLTAIAEGNPTEMPRVSSSRGYTSIGRDGASSIIRRMGAYRGSISGMKLFSIGSSGAQTWARVVIGTILGTPSSQACYQEFLYSGNKNLLDSRYRGSNHTSVVTLAWSGNELQFSCNNGNYYSTIEVELGAPNDSTGNGWYPTWGTGW